MKIEHRSTLLVRHGQASWGKRDYDQLSPLGERQSALLGRSLAARGVVPRRVVVGGMTRHRQTAEAMIAAAGWEVELVVDAAWDEMDHMAVLRAYRPAYRSRWVMRADLARTLRPYRAFAETFSAAIERWTSGEHGDEDESYAQFTGRVDGALDRVLDSEPESGPTIVVTSAGPVARCATRLVGGDAQSWTGLLSVVVNTGVTRVRVSPFGWHLATFNDHAHLEVEGAELVTQR